MGNGRKSEIEASEWASEEESVLCVCETLLNSFIHALIDPPHTELCYSRLRRDTQKYDKSSVKRLYRLSTCNNQIEIFPCHCVSVPSIHTLTCCTTTYERDNTKIRSTKYKKALSLSARFFFFPRFCYSSCSSQYCFLYSCLSMLDWKVRADSCVCIFFSINSNSIHNEKSNRTVNIWNMNIVRSRFPPFYPDLKRYLESMYWMAIKKISRIKFV